MERLIKNGNGQHHSPRIRRASNIGETISFAERVATFWRLVNKSGPNGCWLWMGRRDKNRYGHFHFQGKEILTHRFAWLATYGSFPEKPFLCHDCDNPPCCNPAHLFPGTNADNMHDAWVKGRNPMWKLTEDQVLKIFDAVGRTSEISRNWNISPTLVRNIKTGHTHTELLKRHGKISR